MRQAVMHGGQYQRDHTCRVGIAPRDAVLDMFLVMCAIWKPYGNGAVIGAPADVYRRIAAC